MARPRKVLKFSSILNPLSVADLKQLKDEITTEIRVKERETSMAKAEENARKVRDKIRIGSKVTFDQRGKGGSAAKAEVIGIFADKVQVFFDGRKRTVTLVRISSVE
jgi:hypothetical protein